MFATKKPDTVTPSKAPTSVPPKPTPRTANSAQHTSATPVTSKTGKTTISKDCFIKGDLCINMNNHQNAIFHQITNFLKTPLALLGVDLKNFQFNKICHFANHPYLCKGL